MNNALLACSVGDIALLKRCLRSHTNPSVTNKEGMNCLHLAAKNGHLDCLRYLLNNCGIDVNEVAAPSGYTALHFSVSTKTSGRGSYQCLKLLLERGTDQNKQSKDGQTALHVAAKNGHIKCLKALLEQGADINIADKYGHVAYDVATQQGQFECARLLRALHWAKRKDSELRSELQDRVEQQRQERERVTIDSRLRKEAAERAYQEWAQTKSKSARDPPSASRDRHDGNNTSRDCTSCKTTTRTSLAVKPTTVRVTTPIRVTMHQKRRNLDCTGKPAKLHPYTNSVPQRRHRSRTRSGYSSRATNATPSHEASPHSKAHSHAQQQTSRECLKQVNEDSTVETSLAIATQERDEWDYGNSSMYNCHSEESTVETSYPPSQLNIGFLKNHYVPESDVYEPENNTEVQFLIGDVGDGEEGEEEGEEGDEYIGEDDEDLAFHDVSRDNSLNLLPKVLTKHRTPAELYKLIQHIGSSSSRSKSHSFSCRRRSFRQQRRFSLGAIPEGQIVTNYSNESLTSHDEQTNGLRYIALSPRGSRVWEEEEEETGTQQELKYEDEVELHSDCSSGEVEKEDMSEAGEERTECAVLPSATGGGSQHQLKTLNIINFVWDDKSKTVQTRVTKSPMIPLRLSWPPSQSRPRLPPRPASSHSLSYSKSSQEAMQRPLSASSLPHTLSTRQVSENIPKYESRSIPAAETVSLYGTEYSEPTHQSLRSPSPPPNEDQSSLFTAHSLFSSSMSGIATKSMISLDSAAPVSGSTSTHNQQELHSQLKMGRRIKSAPNMLCLQPCTITEGQSLEASLQEEES